MPESLFPVVHPLVVQHNALVNARFDLNTTESRLFLALLARVQREDTSFAKCQVSAREVMGATTSNSIYEKVRKMLKDFTGRTLLIEKLGADGRALKKSSFTVIPLLAYATYIEGEGVIEAQFNDLLRDYLLELRNNFTKAQLTELLKLKSASSYRIYWLLREYAAFGKRTIRLDELKAILGLSEEYDRFNNFRARVLERAREELAQTDLPFTYEAIKQGREVTEIRFLFKAAASHPVAGEPATGWEAAVLAAGVSPSSLVTIQGRLNAGDYDEGYVAFVIATVRDQVRAGKVKKEGGAIFKALSDGYLIPAYQKARQAPVKARLKPAQLTRYKKIVSELEDTRNSLNFIQTAVIYNDETRPAAIESVQAIISQLELQLAQLVA